MPNPWSPWVSEPGMVDFAQEEPFKRTKLASDRLPVDPEVIKEMKMKADAEKAMASPAPGPEAKPADKGKSTGSDVASAGIEAGGKLVADIGKSLSAGAIQEAQLAAEREKQLGKSRIEAMGRVGQSTQNALAQLISAYRTALR